MKVLKGKEDWAAFNATFSVMCDGESLAARPPIPNVVVHDWFETAFTNQERYQFGLLPYIQLCFEQIDKNIAEGKRNNGATRTELLENSKIARYLSDLMSSFHYGVRTPKDGDQEIRIVVDDKAEIITIKQFQACLVAYWRYVGKIVTKGNVYSWV